MTATRHIPPGREQLWRRQSEVDAEVERTSKAVDAAVKRRGDLAKTLGWDDPLVDEADEEMAERLDEHNRAVAVADRVYQERTAGLSSWIDHDPTAPVCGLCGGSGCKACRGWGREHREPIPVWDERDQEWVNPATGRPVDLLGAPPAPDSGSAAPGGPGYIPPGKDLHDLRRGRWFDEKPITTTSTTPAGGTGMTASVQDVRAGIMHAIEQANQALGALQQAHSDLEQALGMLQQATEGSRQADVSTAVGLFSRAMAGVQENQQATAAGMQEAEAVAARL